MRTALEASFAADQTPDRIAGSFAIGVFLTTLPTLGGNILVMVVLASRVEWINTVALFASGIIVNPPVKWGIYAVSVPLGIALLGPVDGGIAVEFSLTANRALLWRLLVGNVIIAVVATAVSYVGLKRMVVAYRRRELDVVEEMVDVVIEEIDEFEAAEDAKRPIDH